MKIDYQDVASFIEFIIEEAKKEDLILASINELYAYLENNNEKYIKTKG